MPNAETTIRVTDEQADRLYELRERGESYHDVIARLLDAYDRGACELCGGEIEGRPNLTHDGHPEGVNRLACDSCAEQDGESDE